MQATPNTSTRPEGTAGAPWIEHPPGAGGRLGRGPPVRTAKPDPVRILLLLLMVLVLPAAAAPGGPILLWEERLLWPVRWIATSETGVSLVGSDHGSWFRAYDATRGEMLWQRTARAGLWSPPALRGTTAWISPHDRTLLSLRIDTGELLWWKGPRFPESPPPLPGVPEAPPLNRASPVPVREDVATISLDGQVTVLNNTGAIARQGDLQPGRADRDRFWATPAVLGNVMYAATVRGNLWRIPLEAPAQATRTRIEAAPDRGVGGAAREVRASLLAHDDRVYVATMDGTLHCFAHAPASERRLWRRTLGPAGVYHSSPDGLALLEPRLDPLMADAVVYMSLVDRVVAVDGETGDVLWTRRLPERVVTRPAFWQGLLLVGLGSKAVMALDRTTGEPQWTLRLPAVPTAGPAPWQNLLQVGFGDGWIRCYDLASLAPEPPPAPSPSPSATSSPAAMRMPR